MAAIPVVWLGSPASLLALYLSPAHSLCSVQAWRQCQQDAGDPGIIDCSRYSGNTQGIW
jgi:hypothetical protein